MKKITGEGLLYLLLAPQYPEDIGWPRKYLVYSQTAGLALVQGELQETLALLEDLDYCCVSAQKLTNIHSGRFLGSGSVWYRHVHRRVQN